MSVSVERNGSGVRPGLVFHDRCAGSVGPHSELFIGGRAKRSTAIPASARSTVTNSATAGAYWASDAVPEAVGGRYDIGNTVGP